MENLEEERIKVIAQLDESIAFLKTIVTRLEAGEGIRKVLNWAEDYYYSKLISARYIFIVSNLLPYATLYTLITHAFFSAAEFIQYYKNYIQALEKEKSALQGQIIQFHSVNSNQYIRQIKCFFKKNEVFLTVNPQKHTEIYLDFGDYSQFVVLLGDNAQGKTAILQNIISDSFILSFKDDIPLSKHGLEYEDRNLESELIFLLGYSASRVTMQSSENTIDSEELKKTATHHLFNPTTPLLNIEAWLMRKRLRGEETILQAVCEMLAKLTPFCEKVELVRDEIKYTDNYGKVYKYTELSMGQKTIIALMGDIAIRLFDFQPKVEKVEDLQGIVLIDELEAHLHPKWQREFPTLLKTYLPKVQFIVSTHSPMIVLGMPENTCYFHVQKDQEGNIQAEKVEIDVKNMLAGQILTSPLFGLETVRHIDNQVDNRLTSLENAEKKADTPELQKGLQQLKDRLKKLKTNEENQ